MKVHDAPLGPKGRATMVLRVVEQEWSLAEAAERRSERAHLLEVGGGGRAGRGSFFGAEVDPHAAGL